MPPEPLTEADLGSLGYVPGGEPGPGALPVPAAPVSAQPLEVRTYEVGEAGMWQMSEEKDGDTRERTLALAADGTIAGFWSRAESERPSSNSFVLSRIELYPPSVFDEVLAAWGYDQVRSC